MAHGKIRTVMKQFMVSGTGLLVTCIGLMTGIAIFLLDPMPLRMLQNAVFDQYQRWHPRTYVDMPVRIIDIDDESLRRLGQWPWPRTLVTDLVGRLRAQGAASIGFDVMFAEPDRTSPRSALNLWNLPNAMRDHLASIPDHDAVFAKSLSQGGVVLGFAEQKGGSDSLSRHFRLVNAGGSPLPFLRGIEGVSSSLKILGDAAQGNGALLYFPDADGVVRRVPLLMRLGDQVLPSLSAELLRVAQEQRNYHVKVDVKGGGIEEIRVGDAVVPTTPNGEMWVHYTPRVEARYVPVWKVMAGDSARNLVQNHIVIVGTSARGLLDQRTSSLGTIIPGVEAHAQALEQILSKSFLYRPASAIAIEAIIMVIGGVLIGFVALSTTAMVSAGVTAAALVLLGGGAWFAFTQHALLLNPATPGMVLLLTFLVGSVMRHRSTEHEQRWVREAFSRYVSPNRVDYLVSHQGMLELGGRRQQCSFVFTDLEGFTGLMEKMDPGDAVTLLNAYLDKMVAIAFRHGGTLDRIVGDAVAIMFSAPVEQTDHQQRAADCALEMHAFATEYSTRLAALGTHFGKTRIGVHSGEVIVGNFGGSTMFDYRALGDPVNTAARLESVNKHLGTVVCMSEATLSGCSGIMVRPVGRLVLKGKSESLMVHEPITVSEGKPPVPDTDYEAAFALLQDRNSQAQAAFERLALSRPNDPLVRFHLERLRAGEQGALIVMDAK